MADILHHTITVQPLLNPGIAIPHFTVAGRVVDSETQQTVLVDCTGANALDFVLRVQGMSVQDHKDLVAVVAEWLLMRKAGLV